MTDAKFEQALCEFIDGEPAGAPTYGEVAYWARKQTLESDVVRGMRDAIAYVLQYDRNSPERKRLGDALAAYERAVKEVGDGDQYQFSRI